MTSKIKGLEIQPLDTLFFRGGRPFGEASRGESDLPLPQTLYGAVLTAVLQGSGFDFRAMKKPAPDASMRDALTAAGAPAWVFDLKIRGPWFYKVKEKAVCLPTPLSLVFDEKAKKWGRSDPLEKSLPGWKPLREGMRPLWRYSDDGFDGKHPGDFLTLDGLGEFLAGGLPGPDDLVKAGELYDYDLRTGIGVDPTSMTAKEGQIYGVKLLSLNRDVTLVAELEGERAGEAVRLLCAGAVPFGGEGRRVTITPADRVLNLTTPANAHGRTLYYLATPALFTCDQPWYPAILPAEEKLIAAAAGEPRPVSGWDLARGGPKPTRFAAPAGSVYFTEGGKNNGISSLCAPELAAQGWGVTLQGVWNHA